MPAGLGDDAVDGGQAEARSLALGLGGEERLEHPVRRRPWGIPVPVSLTLTATYRPGARRAWPGRGLVEVRAGGLDDQLPAGRHRVAGVDGQVDQDLLDLAGVGQHRTQPGGQVGDQLDVLAEGADEQLLDARRSRR